MKKHNSAHATINSRFGFSRRKLGFRRHGLFSGAAAGLCCAAVLLGSAGARADTFDGLTVNIVGSATLPSTGPFAGELYLTPSAGNQVGAAWLDNPVPTDQAFSTTFNFSFTNPAGLGNADGVALIFQGTGTSALGSSGAELGIDIPDNTTPNGSVAAVFQTFNQTYGIVPNTADSSHGPFVGAPDFSGSFPILTLKNASDITGTETVTYDPLTEEITQLLSFTYTINGVPMLLSEPATTANYDLGSAFGPTMTVGLSASTGGGSADQVITTWDAVSSPVPEPGTWAMAAMGGAMLLGFARAGRRRGA